MSDMGNIFNVHFVSSFVNTYFKILDAAANMDKLGVLKHSEVNIRTAEPGIFFYVSRFFIFLDLDPNCTCKYIKKKNLNHEKIMNDQQHHNIFKLLK